MAQDRGAVQQGAPDADERKERATYVAMLDDERNNGDERKAARIKTLRRRRRWAS